MRTHEVSAMQSDDRYDKLPKCVQTAYTREQFKWLNDAQKDNLVHVETNPEWAELI